MLIRITQDHIDRGQPCAVSGCPLALALSEQTGEAWYVGCDDAYCTQHGQVFLPLDAIIWRSAFDHLQPVGPDVFAIPMPWEQEESCLTVTAAR